MQLTYFNLQNSPEELKKQRNELAKKFHPDKHTSEQSKIWGSKIMMEINAEFDYASNRVTHNTSCKKNNCFDAEALEQAQAIFIALSNTTGVNMTLLTETIPKIKTWSNVFKVYEELYGITTLTHIQRTINDTKQKQKIVDVIATSGFTGVFVSGVVASLFNL